MAAFGRLFWKFHPITRPKAAKRQFTVKMAEISRAMDFAIFPDFGDFRGFGRDFYTGAVVLIFRKFRFNSRFPV